MKDDVKVEIKKDEVEVTSEPDTNDDRPLQTRPYAPLMGFFNLDGLNPSNKEDTVLQEIWDYLNETTKSELISEKLYSLRQLESRLGSPRVGESRWHKIHAYIKAQKMVEQSEKYRDALLR